MGKRDFRWREPRKSKKGAKKITSADILPLPMSVEVIKTKGKKEKPEEE